MRLIWDSYEIADYQTPFLSLTLQKPLQQLGINGFFSRYQSVLFIMHSSSIKIHLLTKVPSKDSTDGTTGGKRTHKTLAEGSVQLSQRAACYLGIVPASPSVQWWGRNWAVGLWAGARAAATSHSCQEENSYSSRDQSFHHNHYIYLPPKTLWFKSL